MKDIAGGKIDCKNSLQSIYIENDEGQTPIDVAEENEKWLCAEKMMLFYSEIESNNDTDDMSLEFEFEAINGFYLIF